MDRPDVRMPRTSGQRRSRSGTYKKTNRFNHEGDPRTNNGLKTPLFRRAAGEVAPAGNKWRLLTLTRVGRSFQINVTGEKKWPVLLLTGFVRSRYLIRCITLIGTILLSRLLSYSTGFYCSFTPLMSLARCHTTSHATGSWLLFFLSFWCNIR